MSTGTPEIPTRRERLERLVELERPVSRAVAELRDRVMEAEKAMLLAGIDNMQMRALGIEISGFSNAVAQRIGFMAAQAQRLLAAEEQS